MGAMHHRIAAINPVCLVCGLENEYVMHVLFFCPFATATWFASQLALRVDYLPLNFTRTLLTMADNLNGEEMIMFANTLWCIWKARNEAVFAAKKPSPREILRQVQFMKKGELSNGNNRYKKTEGKYSYRI